MVLSDRDIKLAKNEGRIIIEPYDESQLTSCAYDVRLGHNVIRSRSQQRWNAVCNISTGLSWLYHFVLSFWNTPTNPWESTYDYWGVPEKPVSRNGVLGFIVQPGELLLGHTVEYIGSTRGSELTTMMKARSSIGRIGLTVCACAGLGDVAYFSIWCMEIKNHSDTAIFLPVGVRVAQIVFMHAKGAEQNYTDKGRYQNNDNLKDVIHNWTPTSLYPRLYLSKDYPSILR